MKKYVIRTALFVDCDVSVVRNIVYHCIETDDSSVTNLVYKNDHFMLTFESKVNSHEEVYNILDDLGSKFLDLHYPIVMKTDYHLHEFPSR